MTDTNYTYPDEVWHDGQHHYLSTACLHAEMNSDPELHKHCQGLTNLQDEPKIPGTCKWCSSKCVCPCHRQAS